MDYNNKEKQTVEIKTMNNGLYFKYRQYIYILVYIYFKAQCYILVSLEIAKLLDRGDSLNYYDFPDCLNMLFLLLTLTYTVYKYINIYCYSTLKY